MLVTSGHQGIPGLVGATEVSSILPSSLLRRGAEPLGEEKEK
jgi:hypothetical protein